MIPVLLTIKKKTLIEDHTEVVLIRQTVSGMVMLVVTIGILKQNLEKNPVNKDGEITRCNVCGSIYHWINSCPDSYEYQQNPKHDQEVQIAFYEDGVNTLMGESLSMAVLESGCTKTLFEVNHGSIVNKKHFAQVT